MRRLVAAFQTKDGFRRKKPTETVPMKRILAICAVTGALGVAGIFAEFKYLQNRKKEYEARLARERAQAEQGASVALLEEARTALRRRDAAEGLRLLTAYLAHTQAVQKDKAERLLSDLRRATAADRAGALVRRLSDEQLDGLEAGEVPSEAPAIDPLVKPIFLVALRDQLPRERLRRAKILAAKRAEADRQAREREEREARVRESAPFKEMVQLAVDLRKRYLGEKGRRDQRKRALDRLTRELNLDSEDQDRLKELDEGEKTAAIVKQKFAARRGPARKAFQALKGFTAADLEIFDRLLDRMGDELLVDV
jgi:hypothetical protein